VNGSNGDYGDDQSFADVVNNLSGGPWRTRRRGSSRQRPAPPPVTPGPAAGTPASAHDQQPAEPPAEPEEWSEPASGASVARPYTWTQGRTAPVIDLGLETLVSTTEHGHDMAVLTCAEHQAVAELCGDPRSVAEVAALLSLPLGVARVVLADMAAIGLVVVHRNTYGSADTPDMALMERVLSGLRRL
jgi:Protein of unknown function (DUF742)